MWHWCLMPRPTTVSGHVTEPNARRMSSCFGPLGLIPWAWQTVNTYIHIYMWVDMYIYWWTGVGCGEWMTEILLPSAFCSLSSKWHTYTHPPLWSLPRSLISCFQGRHRGEHTRFYQFCFLISCSFHVNNICFVILCFSLGLLLLC